MIKIITLRLHVSDLVTPGPEKYFIYSLFITLSFKNSEVSNSVEQNLLFLQNMLIRNYL